MSEKFYQSGSFWGGVGLYYIIQWIFTFYPAFIITFTLQRAIFGIEGEGGAAVFGFVVMLIGTFVIFGLMKCKQYFIVFMLYLITLWPFLYILKHCWDNAGEMTTYSLPLNLWLFGPVW